HESVGDVQGCARIAEQRAAQINWRLRPAEPLLQMSLRGRVEPTTLRQRGIAPKRKAERGVSDRPRHIHGVAWLGGGASQHAACRHGAERRDGYGERTRG